MAKYSSAFCVFFVFISALLSGCIVVRKDLIPKAEPIKPLSANVQPARVVLEFVLDGNNGGVATEKSGIWEGHKIWEWHANVFKEKAKTSGLISLIEPVEDKQATTLKVRAKIYMSQAGQIATAISMMTLIPTWPDLHYEIYATAITPEGKSFNYDLRDELRQINFLPLIIVAPFKPSTPDVETVAKNLYSTLFIKMQGDGVLPR